MRVLKKYMNIVAVFHQIKIVSIKGDIDNTIRIKISFKKSYCQKAHIPKILAIIHPIHTNDTQISACFLLNISV